MLNIGQEPFPEGSLNQDNIIQLRTSIPVFGMFVFLIIYFPALSIPDKSITEKYENNNG